MEKVRYMISDAANLVKVEAHVLRYWEEELDLAIPRNEMGHRYYTRENIREFQRIKDLKEKGYQLKAIRMILHNETDELERLPNANATFMVEPMKLDVPKIEEPMKPDVPKKEEPKVPEAVNYATRVPEPVNYATKVQQATLSSEERMAQFRELMSDIVGHAISLNNEELSQIIGKEVGDRVLKEMNYLAREQDNHQEERYRQLDAAIRGSIRRGKFSVRKEATEEKEQMEKLSRKERKELQRQQKEQKKMEKRANKKLPQ